jgi:hypothetical protein
MQTGGLGTEGTSSWSSDMFYDCEKLDVSLVTVSATAITPPSAERCSHQSYRSNDALNRGTLRRISALLIKLDDILDSIIFNSVGTAARDFVKVYTSLLYGAGAPRLVQSRKIDILAIKTVELRLERELKI